MKTSCLLCPFPVFHRQGSPLWVVQTLCPSLPLCFGPRPARFEGRILQVTVLDICESIVHSTHSPGQLDSCVPVVPVSVPVHAWACAPGEPLYHCTGVPVCRVDGVAACGKCFALSFSHRDSAVSANCNCASCLSVCLFAFRSVSLPACLPTSRCPCKAISSSSHAALLFTIAGSRICLPF